MKTALGDIEIVCHLGADERTLAFDVLGRLDAANTTIPQTLNFLASDYAGALGAGQFKWATGTGVSEQSVTFDLGAGSAAGGFTQYDSESVLDSSSVNGSIFGDLAGIEVDKNGFVIAKFTNGVESLASSAT